LGGELNKNVDDIISTNLFKRNYFNRKPVWRFKVTQLATDVPLKGKVPFYAMRAASDTGKKRRSASKSDVIVISCVIGIL